MLLKSKATGNGLSVRSHPLHTRDATALGCYQGVVPMYQVDCGNQSDTCCEAPPGVGSSINKKWLTRTCHGCLVELDKQRPAKDHTAVDEQDPAEHYTAVHYIHRHHNS